MNESDILIIMYTIGMYRVLITIESIGSTVCFKFSNQFIDVKNEAILEGLQ